MITRLAIIMMPRISPTGVVINTSNAEVEIGHRSATVAHLGNIAFKTGKKLALERRDQTVHR